MTKSEALCLARWVRHGLPDALRARLKAIHIMPKLHNGHLTVRVHMTPQTAEDPDPYIFDVNEL